MVFATKDETAMSKSTWDNSIVKSLSQPGKYLLNEGLWEVPRRRRMLAIESEASPTKSKIPLAIWKNKRNRIADFSLFVKRCNAAFIELLSIMKVFYRLFAGTYLGLLCL